MFTLLFPMFGALWARSYVHDEVLFRVGRGRAIMLSCVRGEVALWFGPAGESGPVRYAHESRESGFVMTAAELLGYDRSAQQYWVAGFGYGQTYGMTPSGRGPVRCVVMPLWFMTLFAAAFPTRILLRHVRRSQARVAAELACCRRCGAHLSVSEARCQACSFPAFVRQGSVA
ncbi:MAG: hypothetical protein M3478_07045 [Planctomycetota bacterium]|nr:hypothetical protein [Planctomycetota bacterium]